MRARFRSPMAGGLYSAVSGTPAPLARPAGPGSVLGYRGYHLKVRPQSGGGRYPGALLVLTARAARAVNNCDYVVSVGAASV